MKNKLIWSGLAILLIAAMLLASCGTSTASSTTTTGAATSTTPVGTILTVINGSTTKTYTMHDIQALSGMLGYGAQKGSKFDAIPLYSGVELKTFFTDKEVGVFTAGKRVKITGSDGSSVTYTYDQVFNGKTGDFVTYDANGNAVTTEANLATKPAITINFWLGGNILGSDIGPLESGILYGQMLYTDSAYWIKVVSKIEVIGP